MYRRMTPGRAGIAAALCLAVAVATAATLTPVANAASSPGTVTIGGKCLDDADFNTANGATVQLYSCNGASAQNWTWQDDGSLTVTVAGVTKCLDVTGGSNATGALVQLYDCGGAGAPQQKFKYLPDGTLYSAKSGKCLGVQGGSIVNNARIGLASCDPSQTTQQWSTATAPAPKYSLSAGAAVTFNNGDDSPASGYVDANGKFYYQTSHSLYGATEGRKWSFYSGTNFDDATLDPITNAVNPNNSADSNADTTWRCNNSPTGLISTYGPSTWAERNYCDLIGVWVDPDTGWWYGLVHNEFTPSPFNDGLHYDAVDYAVSKDHGANWTIQDHALTSPYSTTRGDTAAFPNSTYYYGDGDQRLFVDNASGYFYVFYATRAVSRGPGGVSWLQHVARAPIAQKMAASSWQKWYNGAWQTPGVGGAESDIIPSDGNGSGYIAPAGDYAPTTTGSVADQITAGTTPDNSQLAVMNVAWDAYLGKYIGTPQNNVAQNTGTYTPLHLYSTDDLATEKWTDMGLVAGTNNGAWYRWLLDSGNKTSSTVLGKTFRSYCIIECPSGSSEITVQPNSSADLPAPPVSGSTTYQIAAGGQYLSQSGSTLVTAASSTSTSQRWQFTATGDGFYTVTNSASGQALGVGTGDTGRAWGAGATLGSLSTPAGIGQQWSIQAVTQAPATSGASVPTGAYRLVNRYSSLALSLTNQGTQSVLTAPQRNWDNTGTSGDTRPAAAQNLTFTASTGVSGNTVTVTAPANQTTAAGAAITPLQVSATDSATGQTLTYTATGLPTGLSVNSGTGQITGTPISVGTATVTVTATDSTTSTGYATFTWTTTGTDAALNQPTTASSVEVSTLGPALATDGSPTTRWSSAYADPQWLQVDLGTTKPIKEVKLNWEAAYGKAYQIQTSNDGTTWTTIYSTTTGTGGNEDLTSLNGSGRYIRMNGTARGTGYGYSLWSFQVYSF